MALAKRPAYAGCLAYQEKIGSPWYLLKGQWILSASEGHSLRVSAVFEAAFSISSRE